MLQETDTPEPNPVKKVKIKRIAWPWPAWFDCVGPRKATASLRTSPWSCDVRLHSRILMHLRLLMWIFPGWLVVLTQMASVFCGRKGFGADLWKSDIFADSCVSLKYLYYDLGKLPTLLSLGNSVLNAHCVQFPLIVFHIDAAVGLCGKSDNESEKRSCSDHFRESLWCWVWTFAYVLLAYTLEIGMDIQDKYRLCRLHWK